jgi:hypothetical protein
MENKMEKELKNKMKKKYGLDKMPILHSTTKISDKCNVKKRNNNV